MARSRHKRGPAKLYFGGTPFLLASDELRRSVAFQSLPHAAKLVLLDMLHHYGRQSKGDTLPVTEGIRFAFGMCKEMVSRATFYRAMREIVRRGFFDEPPGLQPLEPGSAKVYTPSANWRDWKSTPEGQAAAEQLRVQRAKKERAVSRENAKRQRYHAARIAAEDEKTCSE